MLPQFLFRAYLLRYFHFVWTSEKTNGALASIKSITMHSFRENWFQSLSCGHFRGNAEEEASVGTTSKI